MRLINPTLFQGEWVGWQQVAKVGQYIFSTFCLPIWMAALLLASNLSLNYMWEWTGANLSLTQWP